MIIIPAIDLLDGSCVRLFKGNYNKSTTYASDPVEMAKKLVSSGCERLHIVDLDAARDRGKNNREIIRKIRNKIDVVIETGGGIRTDADVKDLLDIGIDRLILGTVFAKNPEIADRWTSKYGNHFIAGIDALKGEVKISGWEEGSSLRDTDLAKQAADNGIISIIYTNIDKDGTLEGPDIENSIRIAEVSKLPVIVSGGISSENDFKLIADLNHPGIGGVITGKAVYENRIDLQKAIGKYQKSYEYGEKW
ncbi:MAG: 1-(5-phosphoribosyl)-5-[(5-phosphoribosylamino)methylideneamino]imidazole-4-carboxamide isomerase [Spirochaetia bacterium]|jgi:phosphoribosylformimino-5-aminoimidazole carboxamide ribotide isomerase|nr:1-(5-phosphoribosyl)-5-[(5-phosphoribosylamino)methylideneamino]imidazole-4-carboxamide isomerase [Spirochaetia bacterium]